MHPSGTFVVTGAASGIGAATAELLCRVGAKVILADRDAPRLEQTTAHINHEFPFSARAYAVDVADDERLIAFSDRLEQEGVEVAGLVNCAGILRIATPLETTLSDWDELYRVNLRALVHCTQLFLPPMIQRRRGAIINIASASGRLGFAPLSAYSALKCAVVGYTQCLRAQVSADGIVVSSICPGLVRTDLVKSAPLSSHERDQAQHKLDKYGISPQKVAQAVLSALRSERATIDVGLDAHVLHAAARLFPGRASTWLARWSARH